MDEGLRRDLPRALFIVWIVIGMLSGMVALVPFFLPPESLFSLFPVCASKAAGSECAFCGMTTAFVSIGQGNWASARQANAGAIPLFWTLTANFAGVFTYTMMRVKRHAHT